MNIPNIRLNDGHQIPAIGLGTYQVRGGQGLTQILAAIRDGYRSLDTATNYDNEGIVGKAIRLSGIPRSQFYVTSKLPGKYHQYDDALNAIEESLARMGSITSIATSSTGHYPNAITMLTLGEQ